MKFNHHGSYLFLLAVFLNLSCIYYPSSHLAAQILEQTKTLTVDVNQLKNAATTSQPLKALIKRNREKALWLIET